MGLLGTYEQGLQYLRQQQQQQQVEEQQEEQTAAAAALGRPAWHPFAKTKGAPDVLVRDASGSGFSSQASGFTEVLIRGASLGSSSQSSGSGDLVLGCGAAAADAEMEVAEEGLGNSVVFSKGGCNSTATNIDSHCGTVHSHVLGPEPQVLPLGGVPKVILWLGSSIGNCDRQQAVEFLQQVRESAMQSGEALAESFTDGTVLGRLVKRHTLAPHDSRSFLGWQFCPTVLSNLEGPDRQGYGHPYQLP